MFSADAAIVDLTTQHTSATMQHFLLPSIFHPWLVESTDVEPTDTEGTLFSMRIYCVPSTGVDLDRNSIQE